MRVTFDTEFIERPLTLISIGLVREDGRSYYAVSADFAEADCNEFVRAEVLPKLGTDGRDPLGVIAEEVREFLADAEPEFWADHCAHDFTLLCDLYGGLTSLPEGWPTFCRDVKALSASLGDPPEPEQDAATRHNALSDAVHSARWLNALLELAPAAPFYDPRWRKRLGTTLVAEVLGRLGVHERLGGATVGILPQGQAVAVKPEGRKVAWIGPEGDVHATSFGAEFEAPALNVGFEVTFERQDMIDWSYGQMRERLVATAVESIEAQVWEAVEALMSLPAAAPDAAVAEGSIAIEAGPGRMGEIELPSGVLVVVRAQDLALAFGPAASAEGLSTEGSAWKWAMTLPVTLLLYPSGARRLMATGPGAEKPKASPLLVPGR